jgi:hypothetical protein
MEEPLISLTSEVPVSSSVSNSIQYINSRGHSFTAKNRVSKNKSKKYIFVRREEVKERDLKSKYKLLSQKFHGSSSSKKIRSDAEAKSPIDKPSLKKFEKTKLRLFGF